VVLLPPADTSKRTDVSLGAWANQADTPGSVNAARAAASRQSSGSMPSLAAAAAAAAGGMEGEGEGQLSSLGTPHWKQQHTVVHTWQAHNDIIQSACMHHSVLQCCIWFVLSKQPAQRQ